MKVDRPSPQTDRGRTVPGRAIGIGVAVALPLVLVLWLGVWWLRSSAPLNVDQARAEATELLRQGKVAEARPLIDRLLARPNPGDEDRLLHGLALKDAHRPDEALAVLDQIPDRSSQGAIARLAQGQIERQRNRVARAERYLLRALERNPKLIEARNELIYIHGMRLQRRPLSEQFRRLAELRTLEFGEVFLWCLTRRVDWDPAALHDELRRYVEADPEDRVSRLALADNERQLTRFDDALATLEPLPNDDPEARALRARIALDRGDAATAEALLRDGPRDHPALARLRGRLALARRDWNEAVEHYRLAVAKEPDDRDALFGLGHGLAQLGHTEEAQPHLQAAQALDHLATLVERAASVRNRDDPDLIRALGAACEAVGRRPEARCWYTLLIARDPLDADAQRALFRLQDDNPSVPTD
jgi:tetratricopeptide (TPR) repeat protein